MRHPLTTQNLSGYEFMEVTDQNSGLPGSDGVKRHIGKDFAAGVGTPLYAPESGKVINVWSGRQNVAGGNIIELQGSHTHRFLHLSEIHVSAGQQVSEGQLIGKTGNSGNVGQHLHHDVRKNGTAWNASLYNYVNFSSLITGGEMANRDQVNNIYKGVLMREGDTGGLNNYTGRDANTIVSEMLGSQERRNLEASINNTRNLIPQMQATINELSSRPTNAQYALAVQQLQERVDEMARLQAKLEEAQNKPPVEIIKEVPVYTHDEQTKGYIAAIYNYFYTRFQTFRNSLKK